MPTGKSDRYLDLRGLVCPYPTLNTRLTLEDMTVGEVLEVISDYYPTHQTIPNLMRVLGFPCQVNQDERNEYRFIIHKTHDIERSIK